VLDPFWQAENINFLHHHHALQQRAVFKERYTHGHRPKAEGEALEEHAGYGRVQADGKIRKNANITASTIVGIDAATSRTNTYRWKRHLKAEAFGIIGDFVGSDDGLHHQANTVCEGLWGNRQKGGKTEIQDTIRG
jgi:hypothetical protein